MRIIIICGNPECQEEFPAETDERIWLCPHCDRERPNRYYPFLTAKFMNARIHADETDWKEHHDELVQRAHKKATDLRDHLQFLRKDLQKLRMRLPEEERADLPDPAAEEEVESFLDTWVPDAPEDDMGAWRDLHDRFLEGAKVEIRDLEDVVHRREQEIRDLKSTLGLA